MQVITQEEELLETSRGRRTVVLVHATWCPYCVRFKPQFAQASAAHPGWTPLECIIDDEDNPIWENHNIRVVPTVLFLEDGRVTSRLDGKLGLGLSRAQLDAAFPRG